MTPSLQSGTRFFLPLLTSLSLLLAFMGGPSPHRAEAKVVFRGPSNSEAAASEEEKEEEEGEDEGEHEGEDDHEKDADEVKEEESPASHPFRLGAQTTRADGLASYQLSLMTPGFSTQTLTLEASLSELSTGDLTQTFELASHQLWGEGESWGISASYARNPDDIYSWGISPSLQLALHRSEDWETRLQISPSFERINQNTASKKGRSKTLGTTSLGGTLEVAQDLGQHLELQASYEKKFFLGTVPGKLDKVRRSTSALVAGLPAEVLTLGIQWSLSDAWTLSGETARTGAIIDSVDNILETSRSYSLSLTWSRDSHWSLQGGLSRLENETSESSLQTTLGLAFSW